jgi:NAD(P)-dependent dehydrogenase (short-subunit alcohol dehydrogenase family)
MSPDRFAGRTALVTGAASGIGRETALALARAGADLVVCDLNGPGVEQTAADVRALGRRAMARAVDVSRREAMEAFAAAVQAEVGVVDILMNNAGVGLGASFLDTTLEDWEWVVSINLWGVIYGCHFFVPPMVARGTGGHVVNVSSAAGYVATEQLAAYSTTKFGVFGLSEALRSELRPHRIGVTTVCPGIINTPITRSSRTRGVAATPQAREALVSFYERRNYGPERVAQHVLRAIERNRPVAPITLEAHVMYLMKRWAPNLTARINEWLGAQMQRRIQGAGPKPS